MALSKCTALSLIVAESIVISTLDLMVKNLLPTSPLQYIPPCSTPPLSFYGGSGILVSQYFHPSLIEISVFYMHVLLNDRAVERLT
jgi:hypothetical protein